MVILELIWKIDNRFRKKKMIEHCARCRNKVNPFSNWFILQTIRNKKKQISHHVYLSECSQNDMKDFI